MTDAVAPWLRGLPAEVKIVAAVLFVVTVVVTPREAFWAFALDAVIVTAVGIAGGIRVRRLARRLVLELPFVAFAVLLPLVGRSPRVHAGFLSLSEPGLWAAWNILAKGTLGVAVSGVLTMSTPVADLLSGLERLHLPVSLVMIASFMVRYGHVLREESERMRVARLSRGHDPRWFWQAKATATSAGALFVRAYERGERVHVAMQARGFDGRFPTGSGTAVGDLDWALGAMLPLLGGVIALLAWTAR